MTSNPRTLAETEVFHGNSFEHGDTVHIIVKLASGKKKRIQVAITPTGRSIRVWKDGKELR